MHESLQDILNFIEQSDTLTDEQKRAVTDWIKQVDKSITITEFKLDRTEKVKRTTAILLEETIQELEQKRKDVEAQNRELEVEAALERVRTVAMAMQKPDDLLNICEAVFNELQALGFDALRNAIIHTFEGDPKFFTDYDYSGIEGGTVARIPLAGNSVLEKFIEKIRAAKDSFFEMKVSGKELESWKAFRKKTDMHDDARLETARALYYYVYSVGAASIGISSFQSISSEQLDLLRRFRNVFDLAYGRYSDIRKAEEQAREAEIELALERVRARAMAMQSSAELSDLVDTVFKELTKLDFALSWCIINIIDAPALSNTVWAANPDIHEPPDSYYMKFEDYPFHDAMMKGYIERATKFIYVIEGDEKKVYDTYLFNETEFRKVPPEAQTASKAMERYVCSFTFSDFGGLQTVGEEPLSEENLNILARFGKVFDLTYTRFNDLQKAETQAREAEIELALERVRARTMAMHKSDELPEAAALLYSELSKLGIAKLASGYTLFDETATMGWNYGVNPEDGSIRTKPVGMSHDENPVLKSIAESWKKQEPILVIQLNPEETITHQTYIAEQTINFPISKKQLLAISPERLVVHTFNFKQGYLLIVGGILLTAEQQSMIARFAKVFEQTYTRFLDLKKAEAQAREAQIEAALERVRARAMGMHHSDELREVITIIFEQLQGLGIDSTACAIGVYDEETRGSDWWQADVHGAHPKRYHVPYLDGLYFKNAFNAWQQQLPYSTFVLKGKQKKHNDHLFLTGTDYQDIPEKSKEEIISSKRLVISHASFNHGLLEVVGLEELSNEKANIIQRFAKVIDLTYTRFDDLQKAEVRAREAEQQASLDRVRAEIASMRTTKDLRRITPLIWRELTTLEVPFFRCGMFIIDEATDHVKVYLSTPSGESLAALNLKFDFMPLVEKAVENWRQRKVYREEWDQEQFIKWTQAILSQGLIKNPKKYRDDAPENLVIQLVPFTQGMLYIGSKATLSDDEITLTGNLADAFSVAYTRYEDFQKLEMAKKAVESSFKDLGLLSKELESKNTLLEDENQRKARELEEARQLQLSMLPKDIPKVPGLDIAVYMKTATEVGGDYYDFHIDENNALTVVIGDATGHGLKAGTMVTTAKTLFSALAKNPDILSTFEEMNSSIKSMKLPLLSMCLAMLKFNNGTMKLSSAGIPPVVIHRNASKKLEELTIDGMPLGAMKGFPYREKELSLEPGDAILMMSDGFPELMNEKEEMLDYPRAYEAFRKTAGKSSKEIIRSLVKSGLDWANGRPQDDDITFVVLKVMK